MPEILLVTQNSHLNELYPSCNAFNRVLRLPPDKKNAHRKKYASYKHDIKTLHTRYNHRPFSPFGRPSPNFPYSNSSLYFFYPSVPIPFYTTLSNLSNFNPYFFFSFCYIHHTCIEQHPRKHSLSFDYLLTPSTSTFLFTSLTANPFLFGGSFFVYAYVWTLNEKKNLQPFLSPRWCPKNPTPGIFFLLETRGRNDCQEFFLCCRGRSFSQCTGRTAATSMGGCCTPEMKVLAT